MTEDSYLLVPNTEPGQDGNTQAEIFRGFIINHCGRHRGVWLHEERLLDDKIQISVKFDNEYPEDIAKAKEYRDYAEYAWNQVLTGHTPEVRVLQTRHL